jgi:beta-phosphoglucomutase family hydrolase
LEQIIKANDMSDFSAVIFDLDGVITKTALVHGEAWKRMFDEYLRSREKRYGESFREFTHADDYLPYVDGKPRYKGVASFLESRGIDIPFGDPSDSADKETVCGLGNKKNIMFNAVLDEEGVEVYPSTVSLIHELKERGIRIGVASSSKNCKPVLERAGLLDLFETRIDGVVSAEIGLKGKPEADIFTTACDRLGVDYDKSVVVEDAVSGVQAGRNGNFGFVIGVAREDNIEELRANGADIVVEDLEEISIEQINNWFSRGLKESLWHLKYYDYDRKNEKSRETLLTVGNGYFGTRGAMPESVANGINYPGTYISGLYNRLISKVEGRDIENEDFVNIPNYIPLKFRIDGEEWFEFGPDQVFRIKKISRDLNLKTGEMVRNLLVEDEKGRLTEVEYSIFAGMHYYHIGGIRYRIRPLNYSGTITIRSEIDGNHINAGVERYKSLNQNHLYHKSEKTSGNRFFVEVVTTHSNITIALGAKHILNGSENLDDYLDCNCSKGKACHDYTVGVTKGRDTVLEKLFSIYTSQDKKVITPVRHCSQAISRMKDYDAEMKLSAEAWSRIWDKIDIRLEGDRLAQMLLRLHLYHMVVTVSPHNVHLDAGIPPRGLHGEAYRGHIFWDELYILPLYNIHNPEVVRAVLMYRYRRLDKARDYAREYGYRGAMFPWQSGSDGREETQIMHLNPVSGEWGDDYSSLQRHVSLAIAYNVWNYYHVTADIKFMLDFGAEILLEVSRFWCSKCQLDTNTGRYHIPKVMGPDEFHEKLPGSGEGGLRDNAYTNIMLSWLFTRISEFILSIEEGSRKTLLKRLGFRESELRQWVEISTKLNLNISPEGIIEQFDGYFNLKELDWNAYRKKYGDIHRLDRILKAEGKSPDDYKVSKQADLLMAYFNLGVDEFNRIISRMGYMLPPGSFERNFDYYIQRTSHGSTLSRLVHSNLSYLMGQHDSGWQMYMEALKSDLEDIQGGTTGEGIHCGVMAGTVYSALTLFGGLELHTDYPSICPQLPPFWKSMEYNFTFRGVTYYVRVKEEMVDLFIKGDENKKYKVHIYGEIFDIGSEEKLSVKYRKEYKC